MQLFKQSTVVTISIGPCLDATGLEYTGLVIGDLTLTKNGTSAAMAASATLTATSNGFYDLVTIAGNTDTIGRLKIRCNKAGYQIPIVEGMVMQATVFDALVTNATTAAGGLGDIQRIVGTAPTLDANGMIKVDVEDWKGATAPANTGDAFARLGVAGAGLTALGDTRLANLDASISSVITAIGNLNNLSALINIYGSPLLEIPDSSSTLFAFTVVTRDSEGKMVDLDASPTIAAANAAGTSRSANLSAVSHPGTGRYTFTYSVASTDSEESLRITVTGAISSEARYIEWIGAVVNYDTLTQINAIKAKTDLIATNSADSPNAATAQTNAATAATQSTAAALSAASADTQTKDTAIRGALGFGAANADTQFDAIYDAVGSPMQSGTKVVLNATQSDYAPAKASDVESAVADKIPARIVMTGGKPWSLDTDGNTLTSGGGGGSAPTADENATAVADRLGVADNNLDEQLAAILAAAEASSGQGVVAVSITVNDGNPANKVQNANVSLVMNASKYSKKTGSSGVSVLSPNEGDGTYEVRISASGYESFTPVDLVVSGDTPATYSLTQSIPTPSDDGLVTGSLRCYDEDRQPEADVIHYLKLVKPTTVAGSSDVQLPSPATSDGSGWVRFTNMIPKARYEVRRGAIDSNALFAFTCPSEDFDIRSIFDGSN